jgi:hypothetical protein
MKIKIFKYSEIYIYIDKVFINLAKYFDILNYYS